MKCLILAAGYATRLYPLTENFPKPLLTVAGKSILDRLIDDIEDSGLVDEYIVISNHIFVHHFNGWAGTRNEKITVLDDGTESNETRLGAVMDVKFAIDTLALDTDMLVIAGDNLLSFSLAEFVKYANNKKSSAVMRYFEEDRKRLLKSGVVVVDSDDRVLKMTEKSPTPESNWCTPPFYYYTREDSHKVGDAIADGCSVDAPGSYIAWLCQRSPVYAMQMPGRRYDIGDIESYNEVQRIFSDKN